MLEVKRYFSMVFEWFKDMLCKLKLHCCGDWIAYPRFISYGYRQCKHCGHRKEWIRKKEFQHGNGQ